MLLCNVILVIFFFKTIHLLIVEYCISEKRTMFSITVTDQLCSSMTGTATYNKKSLGLMKNTQYTETAQSALETF